MIKNKRFQWTRNEKGQADIIDYVKSKKICVYNDYGILGFSSAKAICDLLNEQEERIKELEQENEQYRQILLDFGVRTVFKENTVLRW